MESRKLCLICKKNDSVDLEVGDDKLQLCMDCFVHDPSLADRPELKIAQPKQPETQGSLQSKQESKPAEKGKQIFKAACYKCKKAIDANSVGNIEGMCRDCSQQSKQLSVPSTIKKDDAAESHCSKCKTKLEKTEMIEMEEGEFICMNCFQNIGSEAEDEGYLNDDKYVNYTLLVPHKMPLGESAEESEEFFHFAYLHFPKNNVSDTKAYYIPSPYNEFPIKIPAYFSSVVSLSPFTFVATGGCFENNYYSSKICFAVIFERQKNILNVEFLPELTTSRSAHTSITFNNQLYVFGGIQLSTRNNEHLWLDHCERLNITNLKECLDASIGPDLKMSQWEGNWESIAKMNKPRANLNAFEAGGKIYAFGGYSGRNQVESSIERYNPSSNTWELLNFDAELAKINYKFLAASLLIRRKDDVYILGGSDGKSETDQVIKIDTKQMKFEAVKPMKNKRAYAFGFAAYDQIYVFGGAFTSDIETYSTSNPEAGFTAHQLASPLDDNLGLLDKGFIGIYGAYIPN